MRGGDGTIRFRPWFKPGDFGARVSLCTEMTIGPGCSVGEHRHDGEDEIYIVLSGEGEIRERGEWLPIRPGDAILTGRGASHAVRNPGEKPLVIAAVIVRY